jgi:hypothetical protein
MPGRITVGFAVLAGAAALVAAGCGGSSRNKAYAGSKSEFAAAMNSICATVNAKQKAIGQPNNLSDVVTLGPKIRDLLNNAIKKLQNLEPPAEIKSQVADFISIGKQELSKLDDLINAAKAKDQTKFTQIAQEASGLNSKGDADARAIGAPACLSTST